MLCGSLKRNGAGWCRSVSRAVMRNGALCGLRSCWTRYRVRAMRPSRVSITSAVVRSCFASASVSNLGWRQRWKSCRDRASRQLPDDAIAWVLHCACQKPKELGYSYELWTYKLLITHVHQHCATAGHPALQKLSRSKLHKILRKGELRPHKIRYYVECRDPAFEPKMAHVLHVYKEVEIVNDYQRGGTARPLGMVTISYDEKPGIQALAVTTPDRPPVAGQYPSHLRDNEYKRLGTVSLLAGLDLHSGRVIETISDTHKSADFIAFLKKLEDTYPAPQRIRLILDNHSAHISKETRSYLDTIPQRFVFVFTPTHGSWLNLIENQFSKMTRTMLRGIRVTSKQELIDRIHQYFEEINADPVVYRWKYKMDETVIV